MKIETTILRPTPYTHQTRTMTTSPIPKTDQQDRYDATPKTSRGRFAAGGWLAAMTRARVWVSRRRLPLVTAYLAAILLPTAAALIDVALVEVFPLLTFLGLLEILAVVLVALRWGAGPSLVATALGALLLNFIVLPPHFAWNLHVQEDVVGTALFLAVGVAVGMVASQTERARREAQAATQRMDEFVSIVSHELRQPLTSIKGGLQLLGRRVHRMTAQTGATPTTATLSLEEQVAALAPLLERTEQQADMQNRLIDDLLDASRIQARKLELLLADCDIAAIVSATVEAQRLITPERTVTLDIPAASEQPVLARADAHRIGQVVTNYLTNALKYSTAEKPVSVMLRREPGQIRVSVRDEGPGLSPAEQKHIWQRFHRAEGVRVLSGTGVGLGLGLHITKTIVERHGGHVGVQSVVGQGSTFWFTLPLAQDTEAAQ